MSPKNATACSGVFCLRINGHYRLPLVSSAEVGMQSPIYDPSQLR